MTPEARFWSKVNKEGAGRCWLWTASLAGRGYGVVRVNGRLHRAHRRAYEMVVGPIPEGLQLDHLCRVRHCVNPAHLEPVTCRENLLRGVGPSALAAAATHCPHGHPYAGDNLYIDNEGSRHCRTCGRERARTRRARGAA